MFMKYRGFQVGGAIMAHRPLRVKRTFFCVVRYAHKKKILVVTKKGGGARIKLLVIKKMFVFSVKVQNFIVMTKSVC